MNCWQSLPDKFIERIKLLSPDKFTDILSSLCVTKPVTIRINTLKTDKKTLKSDLMHSKIESSEIDWYSDALLIKDSDKRRITETEQFINGHFYIQSLSSMMPALILNPKSDDLVLDITAAPGSKTTQIAQLMKNQGTIVANDISPKRLYKLKAILTIQGVKNVKITQIPAEYIYKKYSNYFDKTIVDVPCTMEGRFNPNYPNSFQDWSPKKIKILAKLQKRILKSAFFATKPGGIIVYSTCTQSPEENEEVIDWLIKEEKNHLKIEKIESKIKHTKPIMTWRGKDFAKNLINSIRIYPSETMEGFFMAKIRRLS